MELRVLVELVALPFELEVEPFELDELREVLRFANGLDELLAVVEVEPAAHPDLDEVVQPPGPLDEGFLASAAALRELLLLGFGLGHRLRTRHVHARRGRGRRDLAVRVVAVVVAQVAGEDRRARLGLRRQGGGLGGGFRRFLGDRDLGDGLGLHLDLHGRGGRARHAPVGRRDAGRRVILADALRDADRRRGDHAVLEEAAAAEDATGRGRVGEVLLVPAAHAAVAVHASDDHVLFPRSAGHRHQSAHGFPQG